MRGISWLAEDLLASQEGLCYLELFGCCIYRYQHASAHYKHFLKFFQRKFNSKLSCFTRTGYNDWLRAGRSWDRIPVGARFSAPVQSGSGAHPSFCTMGTGHFPKVKSGRGVTLTPHPFLVSWSRKGRAKSLLPLWAVRPVQSLSACTRGHFTFSFILCYITSHVLRLFLQPSFD